MTRVAVLADTHLPRGTRRLPDDALRELAAADLIVHAGDFTAHAVLDDLRELGPVEAVYGNMDDAALRAELAEELVVEVAGARIGVVHVPGAAAARAERLAARFPGCDAVVYGHTHLPEASRHGELWLLNPGSPTERRRAPSHTMLRLNVNGGEVRPELLQLSRT